MSNVIERTLSHLRNTRDLRAEIVDLAANAYASGRPGRLVVSHPLVASATVRAEWDRVIAVLAPGAASALTLSVVQAPTSPNSGLGLAAGERVALQRPNYKHEVLRLMIGARLEGAAARTLQDLIERVGTSQTPIRAAVAELRQAGIVSARGRSPVLAIAPHELSLPLLASIQALPQTIRLRFERGARLKPPADLLERSVEMLSQGSAPGWRDLALSGVPAAQQDGPLGLAGVPRLDLVAHVARDADAFELAVFRELDDGLELEPSVLAPAPVVVTLVRGRDAGFRNGGTSSARSGARADVLVSLLDQGLREQAIEYARAGSP